MELLNFVGAVDALALVLRRRAWRLVTAESCTGGLVAAACTAAPGSSDWFEGGLVSYSYDAKTRWLGVPTATLQAHGAVSQAVALAMAHGALANSQAQLALAVTGIAGPGGAVPGKPVGTVWMAWGTARHMQSTLLQLGGGRDDVRRATVQEALARLHGAAQNPVS